MPWRSDDQGNNNWRRLWESNRKSHLQATSAWLQRLSSSSSSPKAMSIPHSTFDLPEAVAMTSIQMNQSPEDQFLHWHIRTWRESKRNKQDRRKSCRIRPSAYGVRKTSYGPRLKNVAILEKTHGRAAMMHNRSPTIKGRGPFLLTTTTH